MSVLVVWLWGLDAAPSRLPSLLNQIIAKPSSHNRAYNASFMPWPLDPTSKDSQTLGPESQFWSLTRKRKPTLQCTTHKIRAIKRWSVAAHLLHDSGSNNINQQLVDTSNRSQHNNKMPKATRSKVWLCFTRMDLKIATDIWKVLWNPVFTLLSPLFNIYQLVLRLFSKFHFLFLPVWVSGGGASPL